MGRLGGARHDPGEASRTSQGLDRTAVRKRTAIPRSYQTTTPGRRNVTESTRQAAAPGRAGRLLRLLTGVDEEVIAAVPSERARYTAMGGVVLGTATMAMFSMSVALYSVFGEVNPIAFGFVPVWGLFILFLDRWLMASTSTRAAGERFRKLFPRFLLATVFGVIIAEPLLLGIFHTAIDQRIRDDRAAAILQQERDRKSTRLNSSHSQISYA